MKEEKKLVTENVSEKACNRGCFPVGKFKYDIQKVSKCYSKLIAEEEEKKAARVRN